MPSPDERGGGARDTFSPVKLWIYPGKLTNNGDFINRFSRLNS
jgi:hypothetical protein